MNMLSRDLQKLVIEREEDYKGWMEEDGWRLMFHLQPPVGWLNDPNGLCWHEGAYHVFFQYSPFDPAGGLKLWGHYKSTDLLHWEYLGVAVYPDQPFDCHGVYSGSALSEEGELYLYYTGNVKLDGNYDYIHDGRRSCTVITKLKDGLIGERKKCILTNEDYPNDMTCHVRDPKVWKEKGRYYMVLGGRDCMDTGLVLLYQAGDKEHFSLVNRIRTKEPFGYMWECPDLFWLDETRILSVSPQGLSRDKEKENIYRSGYFFVTGDVSGDYELSAFKDWDRGFDFYAPQTFQDQKGRRILIGWMGMPDCEKEYQNPTVENGWQHALTMPRVLTMEQGKVYQKPPEELKMLRLQKECFVGEIEPVERAYELYIEKIQSLQCTIEINKDLLLYYNRNDGIFSMSFHGSSLGCGRGKRTVEMSELSDIRIFVDTSSVEVFINGGEEVFTTRYYPEWAQGSKVVVSCGESRNTLWYLAPMKWKHTHQDR